MTKERVSLTWTPELNKAVEEIAVQCRDEMLQMGIMPTTSTSGVTAANRSGVVAFALLKLAQESAESCR